MKKFLSYLQGVALVSLGLILVGNPIYGQDDPINLIVKGKQTPTDVEPFVENSRTLVPVRALSEALGFQVDWKADKNQVNLTKGDKKLIFTLGDKRLKVQEGKTTKEMTMDVPAKAVKNRTFIPARTVAEAYGEKVDWNGPMKTVLIGEKNFPPVTKEKLAKMTKRDYPEIGLSMYLPKGFDESISTRFNIENNAYEFFTKDRNELIASIGKTYNYSFSTIVLTEVLKYDQGYFTEVNYASDLPYGPESEKAYKEKEKLFQEALATVQFVDNLKEEEKYVAYINSLDKEAGKINLNPGEFISINNAKRRADLMLGPPALGPNVYDDKEEKVLFDLAKDCKFYLREEKGLVTAAHEVSYEAFEKEMASRKYKPPFWVQFDGGKVVGLVEIYINTNVK